jgi:hypothetical protein
MFGVANFYKTLYPTIESKQEVVREKYTPTKQIVNKKYTP